MKPRFFPSVWVALCVALCLTACETISPPVVVTPAAPPAQNDLQKQYEQQILDLSKTIVSLRQNLDTIAASNTAIKIVGLPNTPVSDGKPVIEREAGVITRAAGEPSALAKAEALERANAELEKKVEKANTLYAAKLSEVDVLNGTITDLRGKIAEGENALTELKKKAEEERKTLAATMQTAFDDKQKELTNLQDDIRSKERRFWVNTVRITGIALIVVGIGILAISKGLMLTQGVIFLLGGAVVIGIGMAYDIVASQSWFPYVACLLGVGVLGGGGWTCWHLYQQGKLNSTAVSVFNDIKTECDTLGDKGSEIWQKLEPHIEYRFGQVGSAAREQLRKLQVSLGLDSK